MSLSHTIFSLPPEKQKEAIMSLARTALLRGRHRAGSARDEFDKLTRPLFHAMHAAGASKDDLKELRHEWRALYHKVRNEAPSEGAIYENAGGTRLDPRLAVANAHEQPKAQLIEQAPKWQGAQRAR